MKAAILIVNEKSGSAYPPHVLKQLLEAEGLTVRIVRVSDGFEQRLSAALARPADMLIAAGGDGTIRLAATHAIKHDLPLGVIPAGTLNHFSKDAGIPQIVEEAIRVIGKGRRHAVDIGMVGDELFLNNSSVGLYPRLVQRREKMEGYIGKWPAAAVSLVSLLFQLSRKRVILHADGNRLVYRTPFIFIGNNSYHAEAGELGFGARTSLTGGIFCVYVLKTARFRRMIHVAWRLFLGKAADETAFEALEVTHLTISLRRRRSVLIAMDGEVQRMPTPLVYTHLPGALNIFAP